MEEQSSPGKWAQGVQHPPAPAQSASTEYPCPHTLLQAPQTPSPQLSIPLQMFSKATPLWGHWPGEAERHLLGAKLLPSLSPGQGEGTVHSQPQSQEATRKLPVRRQLQQLPPVLGEQGWLHKEEEQTGLPSHCQERLSMLGKTEAQSKAVSRSRVNTSSPAAQLSAPP